MTVAVALITIAAVIVFGITRTSRNSDLHADWESMFDDHRG